MKNNTPKYEGSTFQEVRDQVFSDPYPGYPEKLPIDPIASRRFFKRFQNLLLAAARRTVAQKADLLPYFDKLIHGNGMAFSGIWGDHGRHALFGLLCKRFERVANWTGFRHSDGNDLGRQARIWFCGEDISNP
jgi:hypothetical protein